MTAQAASLSAAGGPKYPPVMWQVVLLCSALIFITIGCTWAGADALADQYKDELSARYGVDMAVAHAMFVDSLHRALMAAAAVGVALTILASRIFVPNILRPFRVMAQSADRIAGGDYTVRVDVARASQRCEVFTLGQSFNRMADQLQRLDSARKRMIGDLGHDLLTPLSNLRGYVEGLRDGVIASEPSVYAMLEGEIQRLIRLVSELHELTLAESARGRLRLAPVRLSDLLHDAAGSVSPGLNARDLRIAVAVADGADALSGDRDHLLRALQNILNNAVQHATPGTEISLSAHSDGQWREIACANVGAPIAEADLPFIFERFFRADRARTREGGAGLGLAIVKELVEAHGGAISAQSRDGQTIVRLRLPSDPKAALTQI